MTNALLRGMFIDSGSIVGTFDSFHKCNTCDLHPVDILHGIEFVLEIIIICGWDLGVIGDSSSLSFIP